MAQTHRDDPRQMYREERDRIKNGTERVDPLNGENGAQILEVLDALDGEQRSPTFEHDGERTTLSSSTLRSYAMRLRMLATEADRPLLELTNEDIHELMDSLLDGSASVGPADGYSKGTVVQFECALIAFYRYHDGHDVDPEEIDIETQEPSKVDERDLWTIEEIEAMRSVINSKRNEALFEILAYTGQRIRVIQTLRVKDVDPDKGSTGRYYVNETVEGRKNREGHGPLLGAQGPIRRWLQVHPTSDPEDALITCPPDRTGGATPGERITQTTIRQVLQRIADKAGVNKDVHPHMFRHYFTTIALRDFGMDEAYVKRLRGDAPGSNVMETTYAHLTDEDAAEHAEDQFSDEEPETPLTPQAPCKVCGEMLQAGERKCENCGKVRAPGDDKTELEKMQERIDRLEAEREAQQGLGALGALSELSDEDLEAAANDDELLARLIELRASG